MKKRLAKSFSEAVLDASALVAFLRGEPGAERVSALLTGACISATNLAETLNKMIQYGGTLEAVNYQVDRLRIPVIPFDAEQARIVASLWAPAHAAGLSLGDRCCLALALRSGLPALTADRHWTRLEIGIAVECIR